MYHLRVPQTEEELERYYQFRWEMLRKPLHQPKGSERDAWDAMAHHQMVVDEEGNLVAVGRLYINADNEAFHTLYGSRPFRARERVGHADGDDSGVCGASGRGQTRNL